MELKFQTKAESNHQQQVEFLKLSPVERIYAFLQLSERVKDFPVKTSPPEKGNFLIEIDDENMGQ